MQQQQQQQFQQQISKPISQSQVLPEKQKQQEEKVQEPTTIAPVHEEESIESKTLVFVEDLEGTIYNVLKPKELQKIIQCRYCSREFTFLAEHLSHLKKHTQDVDSVVEMSIKIWVPDRRLKCDKCKFKTSYTLDYAKHRDTHIIKGLACSKCQCEVSTPKAYGEHMEIHHPSVLFKEGSPSSSKPSPPGPAKPIQG